MSALHRLHLLRLFDEVYVLDRGRVVARGTLDELLASSQHFQEGASGAPPDRYLESVKTGI